MDRDAAEQLISDLYKHALGRKPEPAEFASWVDVLMDGKPEVVVRAFYQSAEYKNRHIVHSVFPMGHFHSPVVDPAAVDIYYRVEVARRSSEIANINLNADNMLFLWRENMEFIKSTPFLDFPSGENRYGYQSGPYPYGDGITLRMMIGHLRPKRIIEIGSGSSSACILDSAEHAGLSDFHLTCIEPYANRLRSYLTERDKEKVTIIEKFVQDVPADLVDILEENDILFIDSTHVLKTGSDVHYELFYLLPRIKPGVMIHFHDITYPFEYPEKWVFDLNYSWNEAYALRAFLMFNTQFEIVFWNSFFARTYADKIRLEYPTFLKNPGGSIWLRRTG